MSSSESDGDYNFEEKRPKKPHRRWEDEDSEEDVNIAQEDSSASEGDDDTGGDFIAFKRSKPVQVKSPVNRNCEKSEASSAKVQAKSGLGSSSIDVEKPHKEFASFQKHTKGVGMKLLMKMGYKPGEALGAKKSGIVNPLEFTQRPKKMGMGYQGFQEQWRNDEKKEEPKHEDEFEPSWAKSSRKKQKQQLWKKDSAGEPSITYKTVSEVLQELGEDSENVLSNEPMKIIDMTGPDAKQVTSDEIKSARSWMLPDENSVGALPEVVHNLNLVKSQIEEKIIETNRQLRRIQTDSKLLLDQIQASNERTLELEKDHIAYVKDLVDGIDAVTKLKPDSLVAFSDLFDFLVKQKTNLFNVESYIMSVIEGNWKRLIVDWDVLGEPEYQLDVFLDWTCKWLQVNPRKADEYGDSIARTHMTPYEVVLFRVWLPKVRQMINGEDGLDVRNPKSAVIFFSLWRPVLPDYIFDVCLVQELILPRLESEVEHWNPRTESADSVYSWLNLWISLIGTSGLKGIYSRIRINLQKILENWDPIDSFAAKMLKPWKSSFPKDEWGILVQRSVIPKLSSVLKFSLVINPANQNMGKQILRLLLSLVDVHYAVLLWHSLIETRDFILLLEVNFFPKWLVALYSWITSDQANYDDIVMWYESWKKQFPPYLIETNEFRFQFQKCLNMMNQLLVNPRIPLESFKPEITYSESGTEMQASTQQSFSQSSTRQSSNPSSAVFSFREVLERVAGQHSLMLEPLKNRSHERNGKPLYRIGRKLIFWIDNDVPHLYGGDGSDRPVSIDQLMKLAARPN